MKGKEFIQKSSKFYVENSDDTSRTLEGYASVFGNYDSSQDVVMKGAFNRSINDWGPDGRDIIKLCAFHDKNRPVANIVKMQEDEKGLFIKAKFGTHTDGDDAYKMAKEGILGELSIGGKSVEKERNERGGNVYKQIKLLEVSLVPAADNPEAQVTIVKSMPTEEGMEKLIKKVKDPDLRFNLEKEFYRTIAKSQDATTEAESTDDSPEQDAVIKANNDYLTELIKASQNN